MTAGEAEDAMTTRSTSQGNDRRREGFGHCAESARGLRTCTDRGDAGAGGVGIAHEGSLVASCFKPVGSTHMWSKPWNTELESSTSRGAPMPTGQLGFSDQGVQTARPNLGRSFDAGRGGTERRGEGRGSPA